MSLSLCNCTQWPNTSHKALEKFFPLCWPKVYKTVWTGYEDVQDGIHRHYGLLRRVSGVLSSWCSYPFLFNVLSQVVANHFQGCQERHCGIFLANCAALSNTLEELMWWGADYCSAMYLQEAGALSLGNRSGNDRPIWHPDYKCTGRLWSRTVCQTSPGFPTHRYYVR